MRYLAGLVLGAILFANGCASAGTTTSVKTPFELAVDSGDEAAALRIVDGMPHLGPAAKRGPPLAYAAWYGKLRIAQYLLDKGASLDGPDGWTPLHVAALKGHLELVGLFIERGANVNRADKYGGTPLMQAAQGGNLAVIKLLVSKGANLHSIVNYAGAPAAGLTAVGKAAEYNHPEAVKYLVEAGSDVDSSISALENDAKFLRQNGFPDRSGTILNGLAVQMLKRHARGASAPVAGGEFLRATSRRS